MKIHKSWTFHTKVLVPESIAEKALAETDPIQRLEVILLWQEAHRSSYHFKNGDTCCHVDNLEQVLHVTKIIRSYPKPEDGERQKPKIEGILCNWWEGNPNSFL